MSLAPCAGCWSRGGGRGKTEFVQVFRLTETFSPDDSRQRTIGLGALKSHAVKYLVPCVIE